MVETSSAPPISPPPRTIGLLNERSLHAALKQWLWLPGDTMEVRLGGHVIDLVRPDPDQPDHPLLIEIQTRNFSHMRHKVRSLIAGGWRLHLVHPIPAESWVVRVDKDGVLGKRRKSPKRGQFCNLFYELVSFPDIFATCAPGQMTLDILLTQEDHIVHEDGRGGWRRKGWSLADRRLLDVVDRRTFSTPGDFAAHFLPAELGTQPFTSAELAEFGAYNERLIYKMLYCLKKMNTVADAGRRGRAKLYVRCG